MRTAAAVALLLGLVTQGPAAQQVAAGAPLVTPRPKLIVFLAVDQMRGDYVDRYGQQWSAGLARLVGEGAWFRQADYPYFSTVTCAGHASMSTGTVPAVHGMIQNRWWDRGATHLTECTDDPTATLVSYGGPARGVGQSARPLLSTTISDELRLQLPVAPRVVSISLKARSAINLGGHRPDAVIWLDEATGEWVTSTAFGHGPAPFFAAYIAKHPVRNEMGREWDRAMPKDKYLFDGSALGRQKVAVANTDFPHVVKGASGQIDKSFTDAWESSPFSDAYLAGLATAAIDGLQLGRGPGTDFLGISFSGLDKVGHDFGPDSHEVQDVLARLDAEIGRLLDKLDREVGAGHYVVALTADHGVAPVPERMAAMGYDAGRIATAELGRAIDQALAAALGPGSYRTRVNNADIYLNEGVYEQLQKTPEALAAVMKVIRDRPGVWRAYTKDELPAAAAAGDRLLRAAMLSYYPGRSGEIIMLPRAYWITSVDTSTHGTAHGYDTRVPVILFGAGIKPGQYLQPAMPLDIAPTLAMMAGVTLPDARGRVLTEALK